MDLNDSEFVKRLPCPKCGSKDNNALYSDGHEHCFSAGCSHHTGPDGEQTRSQAKSIVQIPGEIMALRSRGLTAETCRKFGVTLDVLGKRIILPYHDDTGQLVAYKSKYQDKSHPVTGKLPGTLFGQHLFGKGKSIVITEGELDCLAVWQARPNWPVVSVPLGAQSAKKYIQKNLTYLLNFEEIIFFFDNDEFGQAAAQECAPLLPASRTFIASAAPFKDANEALLTSHDAVRQALWNKKPWRPQRIIDGTDLWEIVSAPLRGRDANWPYSGLNDLLDGLRLGELITIGAGTGIGKSTLVGEVAASLLTQGERVGYLALEEGAQRTGLRIMTTAANLPLHKDNTSLGQVRLREAFEATIGNGNFTLRDGFGTVDPDEILDDMRFLVRGLELKWIMFDHISILMSGNNAGDERKLLDVTMTRLRSFVEETNCGLIQLCHLSRPSDGKAHEAGAPVRLRDFRGSQSIPQLSDIVVALERNMEAGADRVAIKVLKNRPRDRTGPAGFCQYHPDTGRLTETTDAFDTQTEEEPF